MCVFWFAVLLISSGVMATSDTAIVISSESDLEEVRQGSAAEPKVFTPTERLPSPESSDDESELEELQSSKKRLKFESSSEDDDPDAVSPFIIMKTIMSSPFSPLFHLAIQQKKLLRYC
jgi:hypothetical protein